MTSIFVKILYVWDSINCMIKTPFMFEYENTNRKNCFSISNVVHVESR